MEPSHSPLQGPMLVSHYKLLSISLAEMQNDRQPAQVVRAHETIMAWQAEIVAAGNPPLPASGKGGSNRSNLHV